MKLDHSARAVAMKVLSWPEPLTCHCGPTQGDNTFITPEGQSMSTKTKSVVALALCGALGLSACAGSRSAGGEAAGGDGMIAQLNFPSDAPATIGGLVDYNPYAVNAVTKTWLYEPLMIRNGITCKVTPWLATDFTWDGGATTLDFTIRDGVKWSDGQAFTAKDVAFTLN